MPGKELKDEWLLILNGIALLVFGMVLVLWPEAGAVALLWLVAGYAVVSGVLLIVLSFRLRRWVDKIQHTVKHVV